MKVEIICKDNTFKLQEEINDFIKDKKVIDIKYISQILDDCIADTVLIMYEDKEDK